MMDVNRTGNAIVYQTAVNRLLNYSGNENLKFVEIDYLLLDAFRHKLILDGAKTNTVGNYFRSIRAIYNIAIKSKVVDRSLYPFYDVKIKQQKTTKRAIDIQGINEILGLDIKFKSPMWHARNYFMLSFLLIGASFTDLAYLKPETLLKAVSSFLGEKPISVYH
jgi:integrase/recombinase XerD